MSQLIVLLISFAIAGGYVIYNSFAWGYVTSLFYGWFILPVFPQLPIITILQFIGIHMFVGLFTFKVSQHIKDEYRDKTTENIVIFLSPWIVLVFGWMMKGFFF